MAQGYCILILPELKPSNVTTPIVTNNLQFWPN